MKSTAKAALTFALLTVTCCIAQDIQVSRDNRTIAVTSSESAPETADTADVTVGFITYGPDERSVYAEGARLSNLIADALRTIGVPSDQIRSLSQTIRPIDDSDKGRYASGIRFQFEQSWGVLIGADQTASVLHAAIQAGANQSGDIRWLVRDEEALQAKAAGNALAHARHIADGMAEGLHAKVGPLVYASNQVPPSGFAALLRKGAHDFVTETEAASVSKRLTPPPVIRPAKVTKQATVYAVFALE